MVFVFISGLFCLLVSGNCLFQGAFSVFFIALFLCKGQLLVGFTRVLKGAGSGGGHFLLAPLAPVVRIWAPGVKREGVVM